MERWRGDTGSVVGVPRTVNSNDELDGVSCPTTTFCMAAGRHDAYNTTGQLSPAAATGAP